jgi:hypothetical protein
VAWLPVRHACIPACHPGPWIAATLQQGPMQPEQQQQPALPGAYDRQLATTEAGACAARGVDAHCRPRRRRAAPSGSRMATRGRVLCIAHLPVEVVADEHHLVLAGLVAVPGGVCRPVAQRLVHPLEHKLGVPVALQQQQQQARPSGTARGA